METYSMSDAQEQIVEEPEVTEETAAEVEAEPVETEETEGEPQEPKGEQEEQPSESSTEKDSHGFQKRINELIQARREAEQERDYYRQQIQEKPAPQEPTQLKTLADFEYDDGKYQTYLFQQAQQAAVNEAKRVLKEEQSRESQARKLSEFEEIERKAAKEYKDYMQVTRDPNLAYTEQMHGIVTDMDSGPDVMYYLGKNPDIADRISRMSETRQAVELGRIEAKLEFQNSQKAPSVTNAPEPAPKIAASKPSQSVSPTSSDSDKLSTAEWLKRRNKQLARK